MCTPTHVHTKNRHVYTWEGENYTQSQNEREWIWDRSRENTMICRRNTTLLYQSIRHTEKEEQADPQASGQELRWTMWDSAPPSASSSFQHSVTYQSSTNTHSKLSAPKTSQSTSFQGLSKCFLGTHSPFPVHWIFTQTTRPTFDLEDA